MTISGWRERGGDVGGGHQFRIISISWSVRPFDLAAIIPLNDPQRRVLEWTEQLFNLENVASPRRGWPPRVWHGEATEVKQNAKLGPAVAEYQEMTSLLFCRLINFAH